MYTRMFKYVSDLVYYNNGERVDTCLHDLYMTLVTTLSHNSTAL